MRINDHLEAIRQANGDVVIVCDGVSHVIPSNEWASVVLTMTAYSERPNDWQAFMNHHHGRSDLLEAEKNLQTIRNVVRTN